MRSSVSVLQLLLSPLYDGALAPEHRADLERSGLTSDTIRHHRLMSIPPSLIRRLLGFDLAEMVSAMLIPYPSPTGGWIEHVRLTT